MMGTAQMRLCSPYELVQPRHCERSEAIYRATKQVWIASSEVRLRKRLAFVAGNDGWTWLGDLAAMRLREVFILTRPSTKKGRRECRALDAPAASRTIKNKVHELVTTGYTGFTRHSPRNGLRIMARSPRCAGLFGHRRSARLPSRNLTPASGCQDHTPSPSAARRPRRRRLPRPSHPAPR